MNPVIRNFQANYMFVIISTLLFHAVTQTSVDENVIVDIFKWGIGYSSDILQGCDLKGQYRKVHKIQPRFYVRDKLTSSPVSS